MMLLHSDTAQYDKIGSTPQGADVYRFANHFAFTTNVNAFGNIEISDDFILELSTRQLQLHNAMFKEEITAREFAKAMDNLYKDFIGTLKGIRLSPFGEPVLPDDLK